jgi:putative inorganic carbon (hco3(-)) transporter
MLRHTVERIGRILLLCMPTVLALVFYPDLEAPFTDAKSAFFYVLLGMIVCASFAVSRRPDWRNSELRPLRFATVIFVASAILSFALSQWRYLGGIAVLWPLTGSLLFWAILVLLHDRPKQLLGSIAYAGCIAAVISAIQHIAQFDLFRLFGTVSVAPGRMALFGTLGNPDWLGAFLALTLPALIASAIVAERLWWRIAWFSVSLLSLAMTVLTGSRAAMLAAALAIAAFTFLHASRRLRFAAIALVALLLTVAVLAPHNRRSATTAFHGRTVIWSTAISAPAPSPLFGSGPNTFSYLYPLRMGTYFGRHPEDQRFASYERHAQNDFVETYAETGLLGFGSLIAIGAIGTMLILRIRRRDPANAVYAEASVTALVALAGLACFDFPLRRAETWAIAWLWLTLPFLHLPLEQNQSKKHRVLVVALGVLFLGWSLQAAIRPLIASYNVAIAQQRESLGDLHGAEMTLRKAIKTYPASATAQFDLVRILGKQERYAEALEQSHRAEPWMAEPELFLLRSRILRAMGREDEANRTVHESAERFPYSELLVEEKAANPQPTGGSVAPR